MSNELKYMIRIQVQEIFRTKRLFVLMYACLIFFTSILYTQDFSIKVTANLFLTVWTSLMTFLGVKIFTQYERESLFVLSKTPLTSKYCRLVLSQCILNFPIFLCLTTQLLLEGRYVLESLAWAILSYVFAIMLGLFLGNTLSRMSGFVVLLAIVAYNFFFVNPYRQLEYSFVFGLNEYFFNLQKIHVVSLCKMVGIILLAILSIIIRKRYFYSRSGKYVLLTLFISGLILIELTLFGLYKTSKDSDPQYISLQEREVTFVNVAPQDYKQGVSLLANTQNAYVPFGGSKVKNYEIRKMFLSELGWKFIRQEEPLILDGDKLRVNIYSLATLNFENPSMILNNTRDFAVFWSQTIPNYKEDNRYFRYIIDGAAEVIIMNAINNSFGENSASVKQAKKEIDSIYEAPITKDNYVKRIGLLVADQYEDQLLELASQLGKIKLKTDKEFIDLLSEKFPEIYQDPYIHAFLEKRIQEEK